MSIKIKYDLISTINILLLSTFFHSLVLYGWIFEFPAFFGTANFSHFIQEFIAFIANTNLDNIKRNYKPIIFILSTMSLPVAAIIGSLILYCKKGFRKSARWSGWLCVLNILIMVLYKMPIILLLSITVWGLYPRLNKGYLAKAVKEKGE